jgi:ferredoxin
MNNVKNIREEEGGMKVRVDEDLCIGDETCVEICPEIFEMNEEGLAVTKIGDAEAVPESLEAACREAAESCPAEAIIIEE